MFAINVDKKCQQVINEWFGLKTKVQILNIHYYFTHRLVKVFTINISGEKFYHEIETGQYYEILDIETFKILEEKS